MSAAPDVAAAQVPPRGRLNVDHVAHFVPDIERASAALEQLGFTLTPFSEQSQRSEPGGPLVPAGAGNRCVMLRRGYLEFLTPAGDTPVAAQLRAAIARYVGPHLVAFGTADPEADHVRLVRGGFSPLPPIALQRQIGTPEGPRTARFTVVRVPPGTMAEGRIQYCAQQTPELLWQARWLTQANGAETLNGVLLCVADPREAAQRHARFTGLPAQPDGRTWRITTQRGYLLFTAPESLEPLGLAPPALPWIAGTVIGCSRAPGAVAALRDAASRELPGGRLLAALPAPLGGIMIFEPPSARPLALD